MTLLFVCTGNTCRSPLAWAWWRALQDRGEAPADWSAFSAGLAAHGGNAASAHAVEIARGWGVDLSPHRARALDAGALHHVDVVVAVSRSHAEALQEHLAREPSTKKPRVLCLADFLERAVAPEPLSKLLAGVGVPIGADDIADPFGGSRESYESCAALIAPAVSRLAQQLQSEPGETDFPPRPERGTSA